MTAPLATDRAHNSPAAVPVPYSQDVEDRVMAALPTPLSDWLRYEAVDDTCPVALFREWRKGTPVDRLLAGLRGSRRRETRGTYGAMHPQASFV